MRILLQRYLAAQFIMPLMVSTIFFVCFLLTFELFRLTELLVTRDISIMFTLGLIGNIALSFIPLSLPIAVFFSTIFCLNRLSSDSEYIAMRAGGLTKGRILVPFLIVGSILSFSVYHLNQTLIPNSNRNFKQKLNHLTSSGLLAGIKEGQFFTLIPGVTLFATRATKYGRNLEEVFLHIREKKTKNEKVIFSNRGELVFIRDPKTLTERLTLKLADGNIIGQDKNQEMEKIIFSEYIFPISQSHINNSFSVKETMLSSDELEKVLKMTFEEAEEKYRFNKKEFFNAKYEFWNRKNGALVCLVFCFVGFALGITGNRGKKRNSAFLGLICLIVYYGAFFSLISLAKSEKIPVELAVFSPAILLAGAGAWFYSKLDWLS